MNTLNIDIETFSSVELASAGVYKYAESDDFEIMLIGFSMNQEPVKVIDLANGEAVPDEFITALVDDKVAKCAFNAAFERVCLSKWLKKNYPNKLKGEYLSPDGWYCSMILCAYNGLPMSLDAAGKALGISEQKLDGKDLVRFFSKPCKPTRTNENRNRNLPSNAPDKWKQYIAYNKRDVEAEMAIQESLKSSKVPKQIWDEYHFDQRINDVGIAVDVKFVKKVVTLINEASEKGIANLRKHTGLLNPRSTTQMISYLHQCGVNVSSLAKEDLDKLIGEVKEPLRSILIEYQAINKSSLSKYDAILDVVCKDGRVHGMFQFAGTHTLRWAGRLEKHGINKELRQKGKVAELALGYGCGIEALKRMGAAGLSDAELAEIKVKWRRANQRIVKLWYEVDRAIKHTMTTAETTKVGCLEFKYQDCNLHIVLPSKRSIIYQSFKAILCVDYNLGT